VNDVLSENPLMHLLTEFEINAKASGLKRTPSCHYLALGISADGSWGGGGGGDG
jgi:hypothetical protein